MSLEGPNCQASQIYRGFSGNSGNKVCLSENKTRYKLLYLYNTEAGLWNKTESDQEFGLA